MDENEIQQIIEKASEELKKTGQVSAQTAQALEKAGQSLDRFAKTIGSTGKATDQLLHGFLGFTRALVQGQRSINAMNSAVQGSANAAATALGNRGLTKMAKVASVAGATLAASFDLLTKQLESFRSVGRVGALAADGLTGLQRQFTTSNLTLSQFERVVGTNAKALASFRGTTYQGAEAFSQVLNGLTTQFDLQALGMGAEDIADLASGFLERQTKLGRAQDMDTLELTRSTRGYIKELDILAKITGVNREELQQQQLALLAENRFRAKYDQMIAENRTKEANAMMSFVQGIQKFSPQLAAGVKDIFAAGTATTEAGAQAMLMGLGPVINDLKTGQVTYTQALQQAQVPVGDFVERYRGVTAMAGDSVGVLNDLAGSADFANAKISDLALAAETQAKQTRGATQGGDLLTSNLVTASISVQEAAVSLDKTINNLLEPMSVVAVGLAKTAEAMLKGAGMTVNAIYADIKRAQFNVEGNTGGLKKEIEAGNVTEINPGGAAGMYGSQFLDLRADGGPVTGKTPYIVGEQGPEVFVPDASGTIVPNHLVGGTTRMGVHPALNASANYMSSLTELLSTLESNNVNIYTDKTGSRDELIASIEKFRNSMDNIAGDYNGNVRSVNVGGVSQRYTTAGDLSLFNGSVSPMGGAQTMLDSILTSLLTEGKSEYDPALINEKFGYDSSRRLSGEAAERRSQEEMANIERQTQQLDELISIMKRSLSTQERTASALQ